LAGRDVGEPGQGVDDVRRRARRELLDHLRVHRVEGDVGQVDVDLGMLGREARHHRLEGVELAARPGVDDAQIALGLVAAAAGLGAAAGTGADQDEGEIRRQAPRGSISIDGHTGNPLHASS
jgi:hypothetical protein